MDMGELEKFFIHKDASAVDAMQKIDSNNKGIVFVVNDNKKLMGVITDGDIRRWLVKSGNLQGKAFEFMNPKPQVILNKDVKTAMEYMEVHSINAIPVVNSDRTVKDIIFRNESNATKTKGDDALKGIQVVIMAGGKGTRLYPYTKILPKPLIPIGDVPIMERIIDEFTKFGVRNFYVTVNYRKNMIKSYFNEQERDYEIHYVEEKKPLGTAGSLRLVQGYIDKPFIVTNCDILVHADYSDLYKYHIESKNELTIVSALKNIIVPYGVLQTCENGIVNKMEEKPRLSYFVNTGMYILNPKLIDDIEDDTFFHMTDLIDKLLQKERKVGMYPITEDSFLDMGEFEEMHRMEEKLNLKSE